jgi:hypothetical protein
MAALISLDCVAAWQFTRRGKDMLGAVVKKMPALVAE